MKALLSGPDGYGTRWSYDRTISVHHDPGGYTILDTVRRVTHVRQSLDQARQIVRQTLDARPQIDWNRWARTATKTGETWEVASADGSAAIWLTRSIVDNPGWWQLEIDVNRDRAGRMRSYGWLVEFYHPIGTIKAQAIAWASYRASTEESP